MTDEVTRHPFRRDLLRATQPAKPFRKRGRDRSDLNFFAISFVAGFIIFYGMIA
jgi:hypothetical protein